MDKIVSTRKNHLKLVNRPQCVSCKRICPRSIGGHQFCLQKEELLDLPFILRLSSSIYRPKPYFDFASKHRLHSIALRLKNKQSKYSISKPCIPSQKQHSSQSKQTATRTLRATPLKWMMRANGDQQPHWRAYIPSTGCDISAVLERSHNLAAKANRLLPRWLKQPEIVFTTDGPCHTAAQQATRQ